MNDSSEPDERDRILFAFHCASARPTAALILEWTRRHPAFAADIRAHAAVVLDAAARGPCADDDPSETLLSRGRSRALNALFNARAHAAVADSSASPYQAASFTQLVKAKGLTTARLCQRLDIDRGVLADCFAGRMKTLGTRLELALTHELDVSVDVVRQAFECARAQPRLGHAKADRAPKVIPRSYEEVVRASGMSPERIRYWLGAGP